MNSLANLPTERQCHKQIFKAIYGVSGCPACAHRLLYRSNYAWCRVCRKKWSVKAACWLKQSNLSFRSIWLLIWCWQQQKSVGTTVDITGRSYPTVRRWFRRFREHMPSSSLKLSGIVEVDESFFGKQRFGSQAIVVGAIERDTRRVRLQVIPDRAQGTLELFLSNTVRRGSHITTDAHAGYSDLEFYGYTHERCNHSFGHFGPTNMIENFWGVLKRSLRRLYGRLTLADLPDILKEWEQRQNNPEMFYTVDSYLRATAGLFGVGAVNWFGFKPEFVYCSILPRETLRSISVRISQVRRKRQYNKRNRHLDISLALAKLFLFALQFCNETRPLTGK